MFKNTFVKVTGSTSDFLQRESLVAFSSFTQSFFQTLKSSFLGNVSDPTGAVAASAAESAKDGALLAKETAKPDRTSLKEAFPGVFLILDRFPVDNQMASLQSLAEIGALVPDVSTLNQLHPSEGLSHRLVNIHAHLRAVQLRCVRQLSSAAALDVYKALAVLRFKPADDVHSVLFSTITSNAENLDLPDIVNLLQARLMVGSRVGDETLSTFSALFCAALKQSKKRKLAEAAYVVRILNLFVKHDLDDACLFADAIDYLRTRIKGLSHHDLISVVSVFTHVGYPAGRLFDGIVLEVLHRGPDSFSTSQLSRLAAALTETRHCDVMTDVLMDSIAITCRKRMAELTFSELVDLLWAYAHHMHFHHDAKLLECLASGLICKMDTEKVVATKMCVKLCEVVSTSDLGPESTCQILKAVSIYTRPALAELTATELLTVATGCRKTRYVCPRLMEALREELELRANQLSLSDLSCVLNNFAALNLHPGDRLLETALQKMELIERLSPTEVSRLIWSLAYFNKLSRINAQPLFHHVENFTRSNFNVLDTQKLLLSEKLILMLDKGHSLEEEELTLIPEPLRSELLTMWRERVYFARSISPFQQEVSRLLTKMNIKHEAEALIDNGDLSVDFMLFLEGLMKGVPSRKVVMECDGPRRHSINAPHHPLGQTLTFKRLIRAQGCELAVLSREDWHGKSIVEQEKLLRRTLKLH